MKNSLTQERLREVLYYEPLTGAWTHLVKTGRGNAVCCPGDIAGHPNGDGAIRISVDGEKYLAHQLAWFWMTGKFVEMIDHRDTVRSNNRWSNLRETSKSLNGANRGAQKNNKTGLKGVSWHARGSKYQAKIAKNKQQKGLGLFDCPAAAHFAYLVAADVAFGEFARAS